MPAKSLRLTQGSCVELAYGAKSDVGLKRTQNEDRFCADPRLGLCVVCDGMGGRNAGEIASELAVEVIHKHVLEAVQDGNLPLVGPYDPTFLPQTNRLASAIRLASQVIHREAQHQQAHAGMGTTVVSALIAGQVLSLAHVGDSRLYLVRGDTIQLLTADHSVVAEQVRHELLTEEEADRSPYKHVLTRGLGVAATVEVELGEVPVMNGDILVLCSDGLTLGVKPRDMLYAVRREWNPQAIADRLIAMANAAGGEDNTTVVVVSLGKETRQGVWWRIWNRVLRWR